MRRPPSPSISAPGKATASCSISSAEPVPARRHSLPRARGKEALALPVAEKARAPFPQRSKTARISVSPQQFSGTARWTGWREAPDEVPSVILRRRSRRRISPTAHGRSSTSPRTRAPHSVSAVEAAALRALRVCPRPAAASFLNLKEMANSQPVRIRHFFLFISRLPMRRFVYHPSLDA